MQHTLLLADDTGEIQEVIYDSHSSELTDKLTGADIITAEAREMAGYTVGMWDKKDNFVAISPDSPGKKHNAPRRLKIQLGLGCNYDCTYCLQANFIVKATKASIADAHAFIDSIDTWLDPKNLNKIEFWGGEPLIYWHTLEIIVPELRRRFPDATMSMITNGSLLNEDIIDKLVEWKFQVAVSHDGPGQSLRGKDPFKNMQQADMLFYLNEKMRPGFNAVLTPKSNDVSAVIDWFEDKLKYVNVGFEGVVHDYNGDEGSSFTPEALEDFTTRLTHQILDKSALRSHSIRAKMKRTLDTFLLKQPARILGQKCGMDLEDQLSVDLHGTVLTCQNVGADDPNHNSGTVKDFDAVAVTSSTHWSKRQECETCPVLQMCQGACMYQTGAGWVNSCNSEFAYNMAFFMASLYLLTGKMLVGIVDSPMVRPTLEGVK